MKIIRRRRTITIETCAFRRWQTQGEEDSFSCPNCGMKFKQDSQLSTADTELEGLLTGMYAEAEIIETAATEISDASSPCSGPCVDQIGEETNE